MEVFNEQVVKRAKKPKNLIIKILAVMLQNACICYYLLPDLRGIFHIFNWNLYCVVCVHEPEG